MSANNNSRFASTPQIDDDVRFDPAALEAGSGDIGDGADVPIDDEFDPRNLAVNVGRIQDIVSTQIMPEIRCRKPGRQEWFRVHPSPEYRIDTFMVQYKPSEDGSAETYLVMPQAVSLVADHAAMYRVVLCINSLGVPFLWALRMPDEAKPSRWHTSALTCADEATAEWRLLTADMVAGQYAIRKPKDPPGDPQWPAYIGDFGQILRKAFAADAIRDDGHHVVKQLQGRLA